MASSSKSGRKNYCPSISEGLKVSTWLQGDQANCLITVKKAIKIFHDHLQLETCNCISQASNLLILSVDYFQYFLLSLENHAKQVEEEEKRYDSTENSNDSDDSDESSDHGNGEDGVSGSQFPNVEKSKASRYSNLLLPQFVNASMQQTLLKPLNKCIQYLREAFAEASSIPIKLLEGLKINTIILSAHNIYQCYSQPDYRYHCARLLIELSGKILPDDKESLLIAYHLLIRLYLDYNIVSKAEKFLKAALNLMATMKLKNYENYQSALIYLDQCEIEMRNGEYEKSESKLQKFLKSEYLKKLTLNRYHLKGLACLIATKFPSSYQYSQGYSEFIEPLHIALTIVKRWHRHLLYPDKNRPITVEEDLLWFKYEIYRFSFEVLSMIKTFYINIGFPQELFSFSNCLLAISRRYCFHSWSTQIMKIGASIDMKCDKNKCASLKLQLAILSLTFKSTAKPHALDTENGESKSSAQLTSTHRVDLDSELPVDGDSDYSKMPGNSGPDRCVHDLGHVPAWEIEKILRKGNHNNEEDDFPVDESTIVKMLNSGHGTKLPFPNNLRYIELVTLVCCEKKLFSEKLIEKILTTFSTFTERNNPMYEKLLKHLHATKEEFDSQSLTDIISIEANFIDLLTDHYLENRNFEAVVQTTTVFLAKMVKPCFNLTVRDFIGRLLLKLIVAKIQLQNLKPHFPEFDSKEVQEKMVRPILVCKTPPPVRANMNQMNAPERKAHYRMDELRDYAKSLHDAPKKSAPRKSSRILSRKSSVASDLLSSTDSDIIILSENIEPPAVTPARRTRAPAKCKTPATAKGKRAEPVTSTKKTPKRDPKQNVMDSLSEAIECITISDDKEEEDEEVFSVQQSLITEIINGSSSIIDNINNLKNLLTFFSNHPPIDVYQAIHYQLFLLYSTIDKPNLPAASYHLHEASNSAMVRYRAIFTRENKKRLKIPNQIHTENLIFDPVTDINFQSLTKQTQTIPGSWRIVQICSCPNKENDQGIPDLLISRWQKNKKTLIIRIKGNPEKFTRNFMDEFYEIIELSNASIRKQDSQTFWSARTALDLRLEMLLQSVADTWLGPFKSILMGCTNDPKLNILRAAIRASVNSFFDCNYCRDEDLLDCIIEGFPILSKQQFETAICFLFSQFSSSLLEECYHNCLEIFEGFYPDEHKKVFLQKVNFQPVGLIVNKSLEGFPFESLPSAVSANQQFFRIPSLRFLTALVKTHFQKDKLYPQGIDHQRAYYLLNPSANLQKTEKRFKEKFLSQKNWKGAIGTAPAWKDLQTSLNTLDLYIYFGHGAGSKYYKSIPDGIDSLSIRTASLIVGCCSGKLFLDGPMFDSYGTPYRFLINGCPTYLGLLWDVTDGDIDRFADKLLSLWLPDWKQTETKETVKDEQSIKFKELCKSLIYARSACRFTLLTGAAPAIYGLPITTTSSM